MIKAGIIGAAGYTAGELIRILMHHPEVELMVAQSESQHEKRLSEVHKDLIGETDLTFTKDLSPNDLDVLFLCKGHGESSRIIEKHPWILDHKIVDLSQDYRLNGTHDFIYGLPEWNKEQLKKASYIANPGCFATCIQLGLLPAVKSGFIDGDVSISGITGSTGAGQSFSETSHFSWRSNNASVYKPLQHQHLNEIKQTFDSLNQVFHHKLHFIPYRGAFTRGIITTAHFSTSCTEEELVETFEQFYEASPFVHVSPENPDLKQVVGTNKCLVYPKVIGGTAVVVSVIDNLIKGASGQAVQNMNLQFDLEETTGLMFKSIAF